MRKVRICGNVKKGGKTTMSYFKVCPTCGAHLDPQEQCDCDGKEDTAYKDSSYSNKGVIPSSKDDSKVGLSLCHQNRKSDASECCPNLGSASSIFQ